MTTPRDALAAVMHCGPHEADRALAALASQGYAVTRSEAGLDVERLVEALGRVDGMLAEAYPETADELTSREAARGRISYADAIAAEYARLAADPELS